MNVSLEQQIEQLTNHHQNSEFSETEIQSQTIKQQIEKISELESINARYEEDI